MELKKVGKLKTKDANAWSESRLGIGFEKLDRYAFEPDGVYDLLGKIGLKWARIQSGWQRTEREKGVYHFAWLDEIVDNLIARGLIPWMCLCYGNDLYNEEAKEVFGGVGCVPIETQEQKDAWKNYVKACVEHFKGRVRYFEIWNEPDGWFCWKRGVNATELGNFSIDTAKAIKEANPDAYVIGGSVWSSPITFMQEALNTGMGTYIDGISFHEYTYNEQNVTQKVRAIRGLCRMHGINPDIIQGESGSQSKHSRTGALSEGAWTPRIQTKELLRHLTIDLLNDVLFTSYFSCVDTIESLDGKTGVAFSKEDVGYFGVLGSDFDEDGNRVGGYTPKPSYYALQNLSALLGGKIEVIDLPVIFHREIAPYLGKVMTVAGYEATYGGFRLDDGSYALAYWKPAELMTTEYEGAVSLEVAMGKEYYLVDPIDGSVYALSDVEMDEHGTAMLKFLPIRDYPLFLVCGKIEIE